MPRRPQNAQLLRAFGDRLRELRTARGLSQEKLAELADVHRTYTGHLERGSVTPTLDTLVRLADALDVDPAELVRGLHR